jgi:hypothetical protein
MAAAHRGMRYERRTPHEECRWPVAGKTTLPLEWSDEMAYIVGLTATDGCLHTGVRKINFKSMDRDLVATYLRLLGRTNRIKEQLTRTGNIAYFTEFHDSRLYEWFRSVGSRRERASRLAACPRRTASYFRSCEAFWTAMEASSTRSIARTQVVALTTTGSI